MRDPWPIEVEHGRISTRQDDKYGTDTGAASGAFNILRQVRSAISPTPIRYYLRVIANRACKDSQLWEHVSVSIEGGRIPNWEEMCFIKNLFWSEDECVVQFHPTKSEYINHHPSVLHLWRHIVKAFPTPPTDLVGPR